MVEKIARHLKALRISFGHYKNIKNDSAFIDWFYKYRAPLKKFHNIHVGEDCFIMGNGPSLNKMDLSLLDGFHVFGLNKIYLIFDKYPLQFSYHVAVNPLVVEQMKPQLDQNIFNCPSFLSYSASKQFQYSNKEVYRLFTNGPWSFYGDITKPICEGFTVTYVAMQLAYFMGFKRIFLVGVDHNFQQKGKPNEQQLHREDDINHFHPDYFKGHQWHLADLEGNEASYALAKHQFHANGREIYDATVDGKLQIFEKIPYQEAVKMASPRK